MARKTKEDKEKTYHALVESAANLFATQGYARTTLNEISESAGMTRGAFYWHFENKCDVVKAIWEEHAFSAVAPIKEALENLSADDPAPEFRQQLHRLLDVIRTDERVSRTMFIVMHNMEISDKEEELIEFMQEQHGMFHGLINRGFERILEANQLKEGLDPRLTSIGFLCMFVGMVDNALLPFTELDLKQEGQKILDNYLNSVLTK